LRIGSEPWRREDPRFRRLAQLIDIFFHCRPNRSAAPSKRDRSGRLLAARRGRCGSCQRWPVAVAPMATRVDEPAREGAWDAVRLVGTLRRLGDRIGLASGCESARSVCDRQLPRSAGGASANKKDEPWAGHKMRRHKTQPMSSGAQSINSALVSPPAASRSADRPSPTRSQRPRWQTPYPTLAGGAPNRGHCWRAPNGFRQAGPGAARGSAGLRRR
jgi:hypothetical protein